MDTSNMFIVHIALYFIRVSTNSGGNNMFFQEKRLSTDLMKCMTLFQIETIERYDLQQR